MSNDVAKAREALMDAAKVLEGAAREVGLADAEQEHYAGLSLDAARDDLDDALSTLIAAAERRGIERAMRKIEAATAGRVLVAVESIEVCTHCRATFTVEEQRTFDPEDNDHCPKCDERYCLTTYYGDPEDAIKEHVLAYGGKHEDAFINIRALVDAKEGPCRHPERHLRAGPTVALLHGSHLTDICERCGSWREVSHLGRVMGRWQSAEALVRRLVATDDDGPLVAPSLRTSEAR